MNKPIFCQECKRELTGAVEIVSTEVGNYVYLVTKETADCNWRRCRGCKTILCKRCDDEQRFYCCDEGRIVARERAAAALSQSTKSITQLDNQPAV